jgi:hypothetical protein
MDALNEEEVQAFLAKVGIAVADPQRPIGRELHYRHLAPRTVVIHFGEADSPDYISRVVSVVLRSQDSWLLIPRHGSASELTLARAFPGAEALRFGVADREELCSYLCTRDMDLGSVSVDLYVVSGNGRALVTWDHHSHDEGVNIALRDVGEAGKLLADLNTVGAEMEVYYTDG